MEIPDVDRMKGEIEEGIRKRARMAMRQAGGVREKEAVFRAINGYLATMTREQWGDLPPSFQDLNCRETDNGYSVTFRVRLRPQWWKVGWVCVRSLWDAIVATIQYGREIQKFGDVFDRARKHREWDDRDC